MEGEEVPEPILKFIFSPLDNALSISRKASVRLRFVTPHLLAGVRWVPGGGRFTRSVSAAHPLSAQRLFAMSNGKCR